MEGLSDFQQDRCIVRVEKESSNPAMSSPFSSSRPLRPLPRAANSIHPALRNVAAAGMMGAGGGSEGAAHMVPYPTAAQFVQSENAYRKSLGEWEQEAASASAAHPAPPPPVRQPPTMLAALQRPDLTPDARRSLLQKISGSPTLEKKYKLIFSSDARRDPLSTPTHDFTVDVGPGLMAPKVNGFEVIGYSFPQTEWPIEPGQTSIPLRHGWCPFPGSRAYGVSLRAVQNDDEPAGVTIASTYSSLASGGNGYSAISSPSGQQVAARYRPTEHRGAHIAGQDFRFDAPPVGIVAELPLVANPIVALQVLEADASLSLPRRLAVTCARRIGSAPAAIAQLLTLEGLPHAARKVHPLTAAAILDEIQEAYVNGDSGVVESSPSSTLPLEPILSMGEGGVTTSSSPSTSTAHKLHVTDPDLVAAFAPGFHVVLAGSDAQAADEENNEGSPPATVLPFLGLLRCAPFPSASDLGTALSAQLQHLLRHRRFLEDSDPTLPRTTATSLSLLWRRVDGGGRAGSAANSGGSGNGTTSATAGFELRVSWDLGRLGFDVERWAREMLRQGSSAEDVDGALFPVVAALGDGLPQRMGMPTGSTDEIADRAPLHASFRSRTQPILDAQLTPDANPVPDNAPLEYYFQSLNATAASIRFAPAADASAATFAIPVREPEGTLHLVPVPAGEYTPWSLAAAITRAIRADPALRPLRIVVSPVFEAEGDFATSLASSSLGYLTGGDGFASQGSSATLSSYVGTQNAAVASAPPNNSVLGFRFESVAAVPYAFGLAFDSTDPSLLHPSRLGFRALPYSGQHVYDPRALAPGLTMQTFPCTELGNGAPSPLPAVPYLLPAHSNRRLQAQLVAHEPVQAEVDLSGAGGMSALTGMLSLARPALFHHLQSLSLQTHVAAASLLLDGVNGEPELAGIELPASLRWMPLGSLPASLSFTPSPTLGPGRASDALEAGEVESILQLFLAPTNTLEGRVLSQTMVELFGRAGVDYGAGIMAAETGDFRELLVAARVGSGMTNLSLPTEAQVDVMLRDLAAWREVRSSWSALVEVMLHLLALQPGAPSFPVATLGGANGGISTGVMVSAVAAHLTASELSSFLADPLLDLARTLVCRYAATPLDLAVPGSLPATLIPGVSYPTSVPWQVTSASAGIDTTFIAIATSPPTVTLLPGWVEDPSGAPFSITFAEAADPSASATLAATHFHEDGTGVVYAEAAEEGSRVTLTFDNTLVAYDGISGATDVELLSDRITFTVLANAAEVSVAFLQLPLPSVISVTTTIPVASSAATRLAKLILIAANFRYGAGASALVALRGTRLHPFSTAAALADLGGAAGGAGSGGSSSLASLVEYGDPGLDNTSLRVALSPHLFDHTPSELVPLCAAVLPSLPGSISPAAISAALLTVADSISVVRQNRHPFSLDFSSRTPHRIRPERLGFGENEYGVMVGAGAGMGGSGAGAGSASASASASYAYSLVSPADIDRSGPSYLLLSVTLNGAGGRGHVQGGSGGAGLSSFGDGSALISISNSLDPARDRQVVTATAYVQLGSDGATLRLLDRSDDRSPVTFPTSLHVHSARFTILRPDGTPYNFHGRRTMVALRFMNHADNVNFFAAAQPAAKEE